VLLIAAQTHDHTLSVPVVVGPVALRVVLLGAVPLVAGFGMLRAFLPEPDRRTLGLVAATAGGLAVLELLLADALDLPTQVVPLLLAVAAVPLFMVRSDNPRLARVRRFAPWMLSLLGGLALIEFARAWLSAARPEATAVLLHTGVVLALTALCWFIACRPDGRVMRLVVSLEAAVIAMALMAGAAHATVLRPPYPPDPGVAMVNQVEVGAGRITVAVVPHRPGWNLVHVQAEDVSVGTYPDSLTPAAVRPGATGSWAAVWLPEGRSALWISSRRSVATLPTDTGTGPSEREFGGEDGPECASAVLGGLLAGREPTGRCPADRLTERDADTLRATVVHLAKRGMHDLTLVTDHSPRSVAAEGVVRAAAEAAGIGVGTPERPQGPLLLVSGWATADHVLLRVADGTLPTPASYLAPWLLSPPLLAIPAGQHVPLRFTPGDDSSRRYLAALRDRFPGEAPSWSGYAAWLAGQSTVDGPTQLYVVSRGSGEDSEWLPGGTIVNVSGPLDPR
jgi:Family of unknown function (DUF6239)